MELMRSFLLLLFLASPCLLPSEVLVLNVLYRVVEPDELFLLSYTMDTFRCF